MLSFPLGNSVFFYLFSTVSVRSSYISTEPEESTVGSHDLYFVAQRSPYDFSQINYSENSVGLSETSQLLLLLYWPVSSDLHYSKLQNKKPYFSVGIFSYLYNHQKGLRTHYVLKNLQAKIMKYLWGIISLCCSHENKGKAGICKEKVKYHCTLVPSLFTILNYCLR